eukprot:1183059-Prorocentrum_minimum.AAC.4
MQSPKLLGRLALGTETFGTKGAFGDYSTQPACLIGSFVKGSRVVSLSMSRPPSARSGPSSLLYYLRDICLFLLRGRRTTSYWRAGAGARPRESRSGHIWAL